MTTSITRFHWEPNMEWAGQRQQQQHENNKKRRNNYSNNKNIRNAKMTTNETWPATTVIPEAQKPKSFRIAAVYAQIFSGRSAGLHFSRHLKKARNPLSRHIKKTRNPSAQYIKPVQRVFKPSEQFLNCPYRFQTVWTIFIPNIQFLNPLDSF